jgi:hypothetical protein
MARNRRSNGKAPRRPELPDHRERFYVSEVAGLVADGDGVGARTVANRIWRQIEVGGIHAVRVAGVLMLPRSEAERIVEGDPA